MSENEKNAQIGDWMVKFEERRKLLAHLEDKTKRVGAAFSVFGASRDRWIADPLANGRAVLAHPRRDSDERQAGDLLMNAAELGELVTEHKRATEAVAEARAQLRNFGITV